MSRQGAFPLRDLGTGLKLVHELTGAMGGSPDLVERLAPSLRFLQASKNPPRQEVSRPLGIPPPMGEPLARLRVIVPLTGVIEAK